MKTLTLNLTEDAYHAVREALAEHGNFTVTTWLEHELNENTEAIIEMLLVDF
jgi:hypothetical protein